MWIDKLVVEEAHQSIVAKTWIPKETFVVLGSSNNPQIELNLKSIEEDSVQVFRRLGGGGAVVLYPGCLVISIGCWVKDMYRNDYYFEKINQSIKNVFVTIDPIFSQITKSGISDLAFKEKKFAGTSMFRSKHFLLYQASLIVDLDIASIERYLAHPSREPSYRQGRGHKDFLCALKDLSLKISSISALKKVFEQSLEAELKQSLSLDLSSQDLEVLKHLQKRLVET